MKNIIYTLIAMMIYNTSLGKSTEGKYCPIYKEELKKAIEREDIANLKHKYRVYLYACGVVEENIKTQIHDIYNKHGFQFSWKDQEEFHVFKTTEVAAPENLGKYEILQNAWEAQLGIIKKDSISYLINKDGEILLENVDYIQIIDKHLLPYSLVHTLDGKKHIYSPEGFPLINGENLNSITITEPPHAILIDAEFYWTVFDMQNQDTILPYTKDPIQHIYSGFFAIQKDGAWVIYDEKKNETARLAGNRLRTLFRGALLIENEEGKKGVYNVLGKELIPPIYDRIELDYLTNKLDLYKEGVKTTQELF